jgi:hypothetical protein
VLASVLVLIGTAKDDVDPEKMMNTELHAYFTQLLVGRAQDVDTCLGDLDSKLSDAMDKIAGLEASFNAKLDARFQEFLAHLPPQPQLGIHAPRAHHIPLVPPPAGTVTAAAAAAAATEVATQDGYAPDEGEYEFKDENELEEDEVQQPAPGRPRQYNRNACPPPRPVRYDEHVAKLKLNIPPFEGRYNPDAYLTWELEVEQHFACLRYPEHLRVSAATCVCTYFASIWLSEHCRVNHANIPATWFGIKHAMHTHFVPPHYQHDLLKKFTHLEQGKNSVQ